MKQIAWLGLGFALAAALLCAALGWITASAWNAEREERARLVLWRVDSTLTPFLAGENARPFWAFSQVDAEPPAAIAANPLVRLYFQIGSDGAVAAFPSSTSKSDSLPLEGRELGRTLAQAAAQAPVVALGQDPFGMPKPGQSPNDEFARRSQVVLQNANILQQSPREPRPAIEAGLFVPVWIQGHLFLARRLRRDGQEILQGCWLDWPKIQEVLRGQSEDLLPGARWVAVPALPDNDASAARRLASLPVRLELPTGQWWNWFADSPLAWSLLLAWTCVILAIGAIGSLLFGALALSQRRATFVSAVTHELRTPITTLRLYAEMLGAGMVVGEDKQRQYLRTLRDEADRLGHLVENVLAYARIERGRFGTMPKKVPRETSTLAELIHRVEARLSARCAASGMRLNVAVAKSAESALITVDPIGFEQILFNLVDNACKYASSAQNRAVHLSADRDGDKIDVRVRDFGPGVEAGVRRTLFRPFSKSAQAAAGTAPGVGLGLALCRRLARAMGGDLALDASATPGAAFRLTIPTIDAQGRLLSPRVPG